MPDFGAPGTETRSGNADASETGDGPEQLAQFYHTSFADAGVVVHVDTVGATGGLMGVSRNGAQGAMLTITPVRAIRPGSPLFRSDDAQGKSPSAWFGF